MKDREIIAVIMTVAMLVVPCIQLTTRADPLSGGVNAAPRIFFDSSLDATPPAAAYDKLWALQGQRKLTFEETMDLGMSLFAQQQWDRAAGVYQSAAASETNPSRKAAAICGTAQSLAAAHHWQEAGTLMNQCNRLVPNSKEAAALRYAYWLNAGDQLELMVAEDRMKQLDLRSDGRPVCDPVTGIVIIAAITAIVVTWVIVKKPSGAEMSPVIAAAAAAMLRIASTMPTTSEG